MTGGLPSLSAGITLHGVVKTYYKGVGGSKVLSILSGGSESFRSSDILLHLNAGAEIGLYDVLTIKAGINRGFVSLGAALWLKFVQIDVAYGWQEFGIELGDKPVDCLTLKIVLGYDK